MNKEKELTTHLCEVLTVYVYMRMNRRNIRLVTRRMPSSAYKNSLPLALSLWERESCSVPIYTITIT